MVTLLAGPWSLKGAILSLFLRDIQWSVCDASFNWI